MPAFDYQGAKAKGYSDDQIAAYLRQKRAEGMDIYIPRAEVGSGTAARQPTTGFSAAPADVTAPEAGKALEDAAILGGKAVTALTYPFTFALKQYAERSDAARANVANRLRTEGVGGAALALPLDIAKGYVLNRPPEGAPKGRAFIHELGQAGFTKSPIDETTAAVLNAAAPFQRPGSLAQFATSPQGADLAAGIVQAGPENAAVGGLAQGAKLIPRIPTPAGELGDVLRKSTSAVGNRLSLGYSLSRPNREFIRTGIRNMQGRAAELGYERVEALTPHIEQISVLAKKRGVDPEEMMAILDDAIETATRSKGASLAALSPEERTVAQAFSQDYWKRVMARGQNELELNVLGPRGPRAVDYRPRVATQEERLRQGLNRYGSPAEFGTSGIKGRTLPEWMTTRAANQAQEAATGNQKFENLVKSTMLSGAASDRQVAHARFLLDVADQFKGYAGKDAVPLSSIRGALGERGFNAAARARLEKTQIPGEVKNFLDELETQLKPENYGRFGKFMRGLGGGWKASVLYRPGFVARNQMTNLTTGFIFGNTDPRNWTKGLDLASGAFKPGGKILGMSEEAYFKDAIRRGVVNTGFFSGELPGVETSRFASRVGAKALFEANQKFENGARLSMDIFYRKAGLTADEAAKKVNKIFGDYSRLGNAPFIGKAARGAMPFVRWTRNVVPLFFRAAGERAGSLQALGTGLTDINQFRGSEPHEMGELGSDVIASPGLISPQAGADRLVVPSGQLAFSDVNRTLGFQDQGPAGPVQGLLASTYPIINLPAQLLPIQGKGGYDFFRRKPLTGQQTQVYGIASKFLPWLPPEVKQALKIESVNGKVFADDRVSLILKTLPPAANMLGDITSSDPQARRRVVSYWTGVSSMVRNLDEQAGYRAMAERGQAIAERDRLRASERAKAKAR